MIGLFRNLTIRAKIIAIFLLLILSFATESVVVYYNRVTLEATQKWSEHSTKVISSFDDVLRGMINAETGLRGYLITGDPASLDPYRTASGRFPTVIRQALDLTGDNPEQQQRLADVQAAADQWFKTIAEPAIALRASPDKIDQALEFERSFKGKAGMDQLRQRLQQAKDIELALMASRSSESSDALAAVDQAMTAGSLTLVVLMIIGVITLTRSIAIPTRRMTELMGRLSARDWTVEIPRQEQKDEIGAMARALVVFKQGGIAADRLAAEAEANRQREAILKAEQAEAERRAQALEQERMAENLRRVEAENRRAATIAAAVQTFEARMGQVVGSLASAASQLRGNAQSLTGLSDQTSSQSVMVASASEQASSNVQTVATATEELAATSREIGRQAQQSAVMSSHAVEAAGRTNSNVRGLAEAAERIGTVARLIEEIAGQTNLLALNATIEAARAGEAGKGFAVVASEVKNLASQTAKATEQISEQIVGIQAATRDTVTAIDEIGSTIEDMSQVTTTIASAIEQQVAATSEIARNVEEAARGTASVSSGIHQVQQVANDTNGASRHILSAATDLTQQAETLRRSVDEFLITVRAA